MAIRSSVFVPKFDSIKGKASKKLGGGAVVALTLADRGFPAIFRNGTMPVSYTEATPGVYATDYNEASFANTGTMYYISPTGNDTTGDGLSTGTAWRTPQKFVDTAPSGSRCTIAAGRGYGTISVPTGKNFTFYGPSGSDAYVGDILTAADIASYGTLSSGRQTVTLSSGAVSGFVDLTMTRRSIPQVSIYSASAAAIATQQALGLGGVFRSTPSQIGAGDSRDLTGKADTELLMWRATSGVPLTLVGTAQVFCKNITFVGGATESTCPSTARLVADNCRWFGGHAQNLGLDGISVLYNCVVRGCAVPGQDLIDYSSFGGVAVFAEINCWVDQCSGTGADNCSTCHGGRGMRVGGTYLDGSRSVYDGQGSISAYIGFTAQSSGISGARTIAFSEGEGHIAGLTLLSPGAGSDMMFGKSATYPTTRVYAYDGSLTGKSQADFSTGAPDNVSPTDRSGAKSTADTTFVSLDPTDITTLFKDTPGTIPDTTAGDAVLRINVKGSATEYATVTAGTLTYQTSGVGPHLTTGTANALAMKLWLTDTVMDETCNIIFGIKSADTAGFLASMGGSNIIGDYRSSNALNNAAALRGFAASLSSGLPTYHVDGSNTGLTTATQLKAAAFTNTGHVITVRNANLSWIGWMRLPSLLIQFDGDLFGVEISRATNSTNMRAREASMAAKCGATLV